jgi:hypothetical protein
MDTNPLSLVSLTVISCLGLGACQQIDDFVGQFHQTGAQTLNPGRKLVRLPDDVWKAEDCDTRSLPYVRLDDSQVTPKTVKPGEKVVYTLTYISCVPHQPGYILGTFDTAVYADRRLQTRRSDESYPVETGQWVVNTAINVPENAAPGLYNVVAKIKAYDALVEDRIGFNVAP